MRDIITLVINVLVPKASVFRSLNILGELMVYFHQTREFLKILIMLMILVHMSITQVFSLIVITKIINSECDVLFMSLFGGVYCEVKGAT